MKHAILRDSRFHAQPEGIIASLRAYSSAPSMLVIRFGNKMLPVRPRRRGCRFISYLMLLL